MGHTDINVNLIQHWSVNNEYTALSRASEMKDANMRNDDLEVVQLLLDHPNIDVNKADPLYRASAEGAWQVVRTLLENPQIQG